MGSTLGSTMGSTKSIKYPKSTLKQIDSKGGYYFVICTIPKELRLSGKDKAIRRSTKTKEYREAVRLWDSIEKQIYKTFDKRSGQDSFLALAEKYWDDMDGKAPLSKFMAMLKADDIILWQDHNRELNKYLDGLEESGQSLEKMPSHFYSKDAGERVHTDFAKRYPVSVESKYKIEILEELIGNELVNSQEVNEFFHYLTYDEALDVRYYLHTMRPDNPYPLQMQTKTRQDELLKEHIKEKRKNRSTATSRVATIINTTGCPTLSEVLPNYMNDKKWDKIRIKEQKYVPNYIHKCIDIIGDLPLDQIKNFHANRIAETLDEQDYANATIKNYISKIGGLLSWAKSNVTNTLSDIEEPWIYNNPFYGMGFGKYGHAKRRFEALKEDQLHKLFSLADDEQDRLVLTLLITTGMRLDEVCLMKHEQIKQDKHGIRYIDLSMNPIKNDKYSLRNVAIPDIVSLPDGSEGRLFNYELNEDGKASAKASKVLNERYFHKIRYNKEDDRKVCHSLRHNVVGFMGSLTPTPPSEHQDWITGHDMEGNETESERTRTYGQDPDVKIKYDILNRIQHPWLEQGLKEAEHR